MRQVGECVMIMLRWRACHWCGVWEHPVEVAFWGISGEDDV